MLTATVLETGAPEGVTYLRSDCRPKTASAGRNLDGLP